MRHIVICECGAEVILYARVSQTIAVEQCPNGHIVAIINGDSWLARLYRWWML